MESIYYINIICVESIYYLRARNISYINCKIKRFKFKGILRKQEGMPENLLIYSTLGIHKNPSKNRRQKSTPNNYTLSQMHLLTKFAWQRLNASFDLPILLLQMRRIKLI